MSKAVIGKHNNTTKMKQVITTIAICAVASSFAGESSRISKQEYVQQWSQVAVQQMVEYGIPASITLAQAILESANGNSNLAKEGNNHFGIKCHGWEGEKMYKDDDRDNECFRVYKNAEASFKDHSEFLKMYNRYAFLFDYSSDDYASWAKGLKQAGYATNPNYPQLLIDIIEDLNLHEYDRIGKSEDLKAPLIATNSQVQGNSHMLKEHERGVKYVVVKKGDTFYKIAQEFGLTLSQLYRFNDFEAGKDFLESGEIVYVESKKKGSLFKKEEIVLTKNMTIQEISQVYAVDLESVRRMNHYSEEQKIITKGEKVTLR